MNGLAFVGHRCCDHSPSSGYDQVCSLFPQAGFLDGRALERGEIEWHREPADGASANPGVFHVIYGDCSGKTLPAILRERFPSARIVSSAHQPVPRLLTDRPAMEALQASDAVITVSQDQARHLTDAGFEVPIHAVPHGVWTEVFQPPSGATSQARRDILIVGSFLRDWECTRKVIERLATAGVRSIALGAGAREHLGDSGLPVEVPPRVPETELVAMYHRSAALFLPILEATASNALLEAMAAGCPVVSPRLRPLVEEYLDDERDSYDPGGYDTAAERLLHYVREPGARARKSEELRQRVGPFDWQSLKPRYAAVFGRVASA